MATLTHVLIFVSSIAIVWFFAGVLIDSVNRIARRFHRTGFMVSFFILGFLTSLSEISVAVNASLQGVPDISVGNLLGASFVLILFVIPLLAIVGKGIELRHTISRGNLALSLSVILLPLLLVMDGTVTKTDGMISLIAYGCLVYAIYHQKGGFKGKSAVAHDDIVEDSRLTVRDIGRMLLASIAVFAASKLLVEQAVYFSSVFSVPASLVGLILLSVGTNIPELVVVARSVAKRHKDIAFGDYIGSAAINTFIFGVLASFNGTFSFDPSTFAVVTALMIAGLVLFYVFAGSESRISRAEGVILLLFYTSFIGFYAFDLVTGVVR